MTAANPAYEPKVPVTDIRDDLLAVLEYSSIKEINAHSGVSKSTISNIIHRKVSTSSKETIENLREAIDLVKQDREDKFGWMRDADIQAFIEECRAPKTVTG